MFHRENRRFFCPIALFLAIAFMPLVAKATVATFPITFENDSALLNGPFGTIVVSDETGVNQLSFTIDVDNAKLGASADIHQFGFQLAGFTGALTLSPTVISGQNIRLFVGPSNDTKVSGMGNTQFDYLVHFGNGSPILEPVSFTLQGNSSFGLANLSPTDFIATNTGHQTNFGLHVQSTNTLPGSEALGGFWEPTTPVIRSIVPEPTSLAIWLALGTGLTTSIRATRIRRSRNLESS